MRRWLVGLLLLGSVGCASFNKDCAKFGAGNFGADWIVVQFAADGHPFHCWKLQGVSLTGTEGGNVDWLDPNGHLVHLTGWENRVQVMRGDFIGAGYLVGIDANKCGSGIYPTMAR